MFDADTFLYYVLTTVLQLIEVIFITLGHSI